MARKTIGYSELEWICPNCKVRNSGTQKTCASCGSPQPEGVVFVAARKQELLQDEEKIQAAQAGADIHCGFCGTRNSAVAKNCIQCRGDLTAGERRIAGTVVGAYQMESENNDWTCANCQFVNLADNQYCRQCGSPFVEEKIGLNNTAEEYAESQVLQTQIKTGNKRNALIPVLAVIAVTIVVILLISVLTKTKDLVGKVSNVEWVRTVNIESFVTVNREAWQEQVPSAGKIETCELRFRNEQDQPAAQSTEVCGTPYMLDLGNGNAEVVQDCNYRVYEQYCSYAIETWQVSDKLEASGQDLFPVWPQADFNQNQRYGQQTAAYNIDFETPEGSYQFVTEDVALFNACQPGSRWELTLNAFNRVTAIRPLE